DVVLATLALGVATTLFVFGVQSSNTPTGRLNGIPTAVFFIFGLVALLAGAADLRLLPSGGTRLLRGAPRVARHLWRMCFAQLIAAFSFFLGQAKVFPKEFRIIPLLLVPPLIVLATLLYWLWRVRFKRSLRGITTVRAPEPA